MRGRAGLRLAAAALVGFCGTGLDSHGAVTPDMRSATSEARTAPWVSEADSSEWVGARLAEIDFGPNGRSEGG
ncbi:MAG TPA: hypothetical protein VF720_05980, partial [Candidatus Eisenbacteria bacterium]